METKTMEQLEAALTPVALETIIKSAADRMETIQTALKEKAAAMSNAEMYNAMIDYCCKTVGTYIDNPENMKKILTDSTNIEGIYAEMTGTEEFKELATKEAAGLPRIIAMTILTGTESNACLDAAEVLKDTDPAVGFELENLAVTYEKYMKDSLAYGTGNKTVSVVGTDSSKFH